MTARIGVPGELQVDVQARGPDHPVRAAVPPVASAPVQVTPIDPEFDFPDTAEELAEWSGGEVTWRADDLAVVRATYA